MIKIITSSEEFMECDVFWATLGSYCNIFTLKQWLLTWWKCYGENRNLKLYVLLDENNNAVAILPLMSRNEDGKIILSQLCDSCSDYYKVICDSSIFYEIKKILEYIIQNETFDKFEINNLRIDDKNTRLLIRAALLVNKKIVVTIQERNYFIKTVGKYEDYFVRQSKNFRHKINQTRKNEQQFKFDIITDYNKKIIDIITKIHCQKWNNDMQVSVFFDQRRMDFLESICKEYSKSGMLRIFVLKDNDRIVAYRLGFIHNNIYYDWNTSYDIAYKNMSVGILLCDCVVRYCFAENIEEFDFLRGEEDYKKKFATGNRELLKINICKEMDRINNMILAPQIRIEQLMKNTKGFIFDLDGVVYSGKKPIITTIEFINFLLGKNYKVGFLTNTSSKFVNTIQTSLKTMGIEGKGYYIETSSTATAEYMKEKEIKKCVVYGGDEVLAEEIRKNEIEVLDICKCDCNVDAVVIGYSKKFQYDDLTRISELISNGAELIATDEDKMFSHNNRCLPGTAWILSSIETVNRRKAYIIGKPNSYSALNLLRKMELSSKNVIVIGDNIESDIMMAKGIGSFSCLLLGGVSSKHDVAKMKMSDRPDIITDNLCKLKKYINIKGDLL